MNPQVYDAKSKTPYAHALGRSVDRLGGLRNQKTKRPIIKGNDPKKGLRGLRIRTVYPTAEIPARAHTMARADPCRFDRHRIRTL